MIVGVEEEFCSRCARWVDTEDYDYDERWCKRCVAEGKYGKDVVQCPNCGRWYPNTDRHRTQCSSCRAKFSRERSPKDHIKIRGCVLCGRKFRSNKPSAMFCYFHRRWRRQYWLARKRGETHTQALARVKLMSDPARPRVCSFCSDPIQEGRYCLACKEPKRSYLRWRKKGMNEQEAIGMVLMTYRGKRWKEVARRAKLQSRT